MDFTLVIVTHEDMFPGDMQVYANAPGRVIFLEHKSDQELQELNDAGMLESAAVIEFDGPGQYEAIVAPVNIEPSLVDRTVVRTEQELAAKQTNAQIASLQEEIKAAVAKIKALKKIS